MGKVSLSPATSSWLLVGIGAVLAAASAFVPDATLSTVLVLSGLVVWSAGVITQFILVAGMLAGRRKR